MNISLVASFIVSLAICVVAWFWWPADKRNRKNVFATGVALASILMIGVIISKFIPIQQVEVKKVYTKYVKPPTVIYQDRIVYKIPGKELEAVDVKKICEGSSPVTIDSMSAVKAEKSDETMTWISGHIPGSEVLFMCGVPGDFSGYWKVGQTVQFVRGQPQ